MVALAVMAVLAGCNRPAPRVAATWRWVAGHTAPEFDPGGPPDELRLALERALSFGLFGHDSAGAVVPLAASAARADSGGRLWRVTLREGLRFTDGAPATAADFRAALLRDLARTDHASAAWLLAGLRGVDRIRPGKPLPALGLEAPDPRTLVFHMAQPEPDLPARLAAWGLGTPWHGASTGWSTAAGLGPYRVLREDAGRGLVLVPAATPGPRRALADTLVVRFVVGAPRLRVLLRRDAADVAWPLPPTLFSTPLPAGWSVRTLAARPARALVLVLRADVPPTTQVAARQALAHALHLPELAEALGGPGFAGRGWIEGAGAFDYARVDPAESREWLERGRLGASFHVDLAYDADGPGAEIARALQGQWARQGFYAELRALRGREAVEVPLAASAPQAQLVVARPPLPGVQAQLATLVLPLRGPAVGSFRTGWRTRDFDPWLGPGPVPPGLDPEAVQQRLAEEALAVPVAPLPWRWLVRAGGPDVPFRAVAGPEFTALRAAGTEGNPAGSR